MPQPEPLQNLPDPHACPQLIRHVPSPLERQGLLQSIMGFQQFVLGDLCSDSLLPYNQDAVDLGDCNTSPNPRLLFNPVSFLASSPKSHSHPVMHWLQAWRQIKLSEKWMYEPTSSLSKMFLWLYFIPSFMEKVHFVPPHLQQWPHRAFCWSYFRVTVSLQQVFKIRAYRGG